MGMAASQARLLTITARLSDNEFRSQTINNAKMRLATQSSQASENYINALNDATYKFSNYDMTGQAISQDLTYNALTSYSPYNTQYGLINAAGQILVSEAEAKMFVDSKGNLDNYLAKHGLTYSTTYFDQNGGLTFKHTNYPSGYDNVDKTKLKSYYEAYDSYQNSQEVEEFEKFQSNFFQNGKDIKSYGREILDAYLTASTEGLDAGISKDDKGWYSIGSGIYSLPEHLVTGDLCFKGYLFDKLACNTDNPFYAYDWSTAILSYDEDKLKPITGNNVPSVFYKLYNDGYITQKTVEECFDIVNTLKYDDVNNSLNEVSNLSFNRSEVKEKDASGNETGNITSATYTINEGDIVITYDGTKWSIDVKGLTKENETEPADTSVTDPTYSAIDVYYGANKINATTDVSDIGSTQPTTDNVNTILKTIIDKLKYDSNTYDKNHNIKSTDSTTKYEFNDGKVSATTPYTGDVSELYTSVFTKMVNKILANANYDNVLAQMFDSESAIYKSAQNLNFGEKTITDLITNYTNSRDNYLKRIFGEEEITVKDNDGNDKTYLLYQYVDELISNGGTKVTMYDENGYILDKNGNSSEDTEVGDDGLIAIKTYDEDGNEITKRVEPDIRTLTYENLKDLDFLMQFMKYLQVNNGVSQPMSDSFKTVIQEYIVDATINNFGTPKYAWLDENDTTNTENADTKAQWYTNLFKRMQKGFKALEDGLASSKEWIEYALENGSVYMEQVDNSFNWNALDFKTCTKITEETSDVFLAKAEAEYNRAMKDIEAKDNIFDLELKNIDTEHNALQTEYDVIKGVLNKNIERNFKFNQSA